MAPQVTFADAGPTASCSRSDSRPASVGTKKSTNSTQAQDFASTVKGAGSATEADPSEDQKSPPPTRVSTGLSDTSISSSLAELAETSFALKDQLDGKPPSNPSPSDAAQATSPPEPTRESDKGERPRGEEPVAEFAKRNILGGIGTQAWEESYTR